MKQYHTIVARAVLLLLVKIDYLYIAMLACVLLFKKWIATTLIGTYIQWVLVIDVYTYTPEFTVINPQYAEVVIHYSLLMQKLFSTSVINLKTKVASVGC